MFLQFGTSRFLQAHADLIIAETMAAGAICVVQSSGQTATAGRLSHLADPSGYPVHIRGQQAGATIDRKVAVTSIGRALSTATEWAEVLEVGTSCDFILSNVSEAGYRPQVADATPAFDNAMSFVAKLTLLLGARYQAGGGRCTILPLELFPDNGTHLHALVRAQAEKWGFKDGVIDAIDGHIWVNSLVDRIVSEPLDPVGAVAEPYCLWAIEDRDGLDLPFANHPSVTLTNDLKRFEQLKLFLLNLSHTYMAEIWLSRSLAPDLLVKDFVGDAALFHELCDLVQTEVLPSFEHAGLGAAARAYFDVTLERFQNPFLCHRLADIAGGHASKVASRIGAFLDWADTQSVAQSAPRLREITKVYAK